MKTDSNVAGLLRTPFVPMPGTGYLASITAHLSQQNKEAEKIASNPSTYINQESKASTNMEDAPPINDQVKQPPVDVLSDVVCMDQA